MTRSQQILVKQSKAREQLNALLAIEPDERSDDQRGEVGTLTTELTGLEPELRAALAAEGPAVETRTDNLDSEARERLELRSKASLGAFVVAALQGRMPSGAEQEYREACGAQPGHIPLDLWEQDRPVLTAEERAATPAPTTGTGVNVAPISPFIFSPSIAPRLGIQIPQVPSGSWSEMTITTSVPASPKAKGVDADDTAAALTAVTAGPRRISARLSLTMEDVAAVGQSGFESMLRENASMKLADAYDAQCIAGNGTAPNVDGLINQLTDPSNPTAVADFDAFVAAFADQIDGLWASRMREVAIVAGVDAYKLSAKTFRDAAAADLGDINFADYAEKMLGGWWCNSRMPATPTSGADQNIARGIVYRMGRMGMRTAVHPSWGSVGIDDQYTDSRSGVRHFSLHTMVGDKVLIVQPGAYGLVEYKVA